MDTIQITTQSLEHVLKASTSTEELFFTGLATLIATLISTGFVAWRNNCALKERDKIFEKRQHNKEQKELEAAVNTLSESLAILADHLADDDPLNTRLISFDLREATSNAIIKVAPDAFKFTNQAFWLTQKHYETIADPDTKIRGNKDLKKYKDESGCYSLLALSVLQCTTDYDLKVKSQPERYFPTHYDNYLISLESTLKKCYESLNTTQAFDTQKFLQNYRYCKSQILNQVVSNK